MDPRPCAWALVALAALLPATAAQPAGVDLCIITFEPSRDFGTIAVRADQVLTAQDKDNLTAELDEDGDGVITDADVDAYEAGSFQEFHDVQGLGAKKLLLDAREPRVVVFHRDLKNVEGNSTDRSDWVVTEVREYSFAASVATEHRIEGGLYAYAQPTPVVEFVVVRAPIGWVVQRVNDTRYDQPVVNLPAFNTNQFFAITYRQMLGGATTDYRPVDETPFAPVPLIAAASVLAAVLAGRRR